MNMEKACRLGNCKAIKQLVEETPDIINEVDTKIGWTPLYRTVICSHIDATKLLIKLGSNPNIQNKLGETPLHKAADSGLGRISKILLDAKADPNLQTNEGETALHLATLRQNIKLTNILLQANANPNIKNFKYGQTPLHYAVDLGYNKIAEMMIAYDASPLIKDKSDKSAMDLAGSPEMQRLLVEPPKPPDSPGIKELLTIDKSFVEEEEKAPEVFQIPDMPSLAASTVASPDPPTKTVEIFEKAAGFEELESWEPDAGPNVSTSKTTMNVSFGERKITNPLMLSWLTQNKLEECYEVLEAAGYDDIELMAEQMKSTMPITSRTLEKVGITKPGYRARLLAKLVDVSLDQSTKVRPSNVPAKTKIFEWVSAPAPEPALFSYPALKDWLQVINLGSLIGNFEASGYDDYEEILYLMSTGYPLTDMILENDVNISKMGHRQRILLKLQQDIASAGHDKRKRMTMEKGSSKLVSCDACALM